MRVIGPSPARPRGRGGFARLPTTPEHLLRPPATTVRGTLDQAAPLLPTVLGLLTPTRDICRLISRAGYSPLRQDRRHLSPCQVRENWRGLPRSGLADPGMGTEAVRSAAVDVSDY